MSKFHLFVHSLLLVTSPSLLAYPQYQQPDIQQVYNQEKPFDEFNLTYDEILKLLQDIENERLEDLSEEKINRITLAKSLATISGGLQFVIFSCRKFKRIASV